MANKVTSIVDKIIQLVILYKQTKTKKCISGFTYR